GVEAQRHLPSVPPRRSSDLTDRCCKAAMSPALPIVSGQQVVTALERIGFFHTSQRGSHVKLRHKDGRIVIVPMHYELARGTLKSDRKSTRLNSSHVKISYAV